MTFGEAYKNLDSKCRSGRNETTPDAARYQAIKSVVLKSGVPEGRREELELRNSKQWKEINEEVKKWRSWDDFDVP